MDRLTVNDLNKVWYDPWELCGMDSYCRKGCHEEGGCTKGCHILKMYQKLAEYEDLEEQGKLMKTPCKIGNPVYKIYYSDNEIKEKTVKGFSDTGMWLDYDCFQTSFSEIGRTIFLTQKDAEIALKNAKEASESLADRVIYWESVRVIAGTEEDRWVSCSNCGNMINLYDIEQMRFDGVHGDEQYNKAIKTKYYICEKCGSEMDVKLSRILEKKRIAKGDYFEDGYKKEIARILISDEYTSRKIKEVV